MPIIKILPNNKKKGMVQTTLSTLLRHLGSTFFFAGNYIGRRVPAGPSGPSKGPRGPSGALSIKTILFTLGSRAPLGPYIGGRAPAGALSRKKKVEHLGSS